MKLLKFLEPSSYLFNAYASATAGNEILNALCPVSDSQDAAQKCGKESGIFTTPV
ncbi:hypothetical protein ACSF6T_13010 [Escherichia coli]|uniref:hypothetical protein n=1 Tax=Escherichia coli TaxID=562 RepID=UPI003EED8C75